MAEAGSAGGVRKCLKAFRELGARRECPAGGVDGVLSATGQGQRERGLGGERRTGEELKRQQELDK